MHKRRPKLKVPRAQRQHGSQRILLRNRQTGHDVRRNGRDGGARNGIRQLRQDLRVLVLVGEQRADDGPASMVQHGIDIRHGVHADVVRRGQDQPPKRLILLRRADGCHAAHPVGVVGRDGDVALVPRRQDLMARPGAVKPVRDDAVPVEDRWRLDDGGHGALVVVDAAREGVDLVPLLRHEPAVVQDLEGEAARLVEEAADLGGVDFEVRVPELVEVGLGDGLAGDGELDGAAGDGDVGVGLDPFAWHVDHLLLLLLLLMTNTNDYVVWCNRYIQVSDVSVKRNRNMAV